MKCLYIKTPGDIDRALEIKSELAGLEEFHCRNNTLNTAQLEDILSHAPSLQLLDLYKSRITGNPVKLKHIKLNMLEELNCMHSSITGYQVAEIIKIAPNLKRLDISRCNDLWDLIKLGEAVLQRLDTLYCNSITHYNLGQILLAAPKLKWSKGNLLTRLSDDNDQYEQAVALHLFYKHRLTVAEQEKIMSTLNNHFMRILFRSRFKALLLYKAEDPNPVIRTLHDIHATINFWSGPLKSLTAAITPPSKEISISDIMAFPEIQFKILSYVITADCGNNLERAQISRFHEFFCDKNGPYGKTPSLAELLVQGFENMLFYKAAVVSFLVLLKQLTQRAASNLSLQDDLKENRVKTQLFQPFYAAYKTRSDRERLPATILGNLPPMLPYKDAMELQPKFKAAMEPKVVVQRDAEMISPYNFRMMFRD